MKQKQTLKEKCEIVTPYGIAELLENNSKQDNLDDVNFKLASLSTITTTRNKLNSDFHRLKKYQELLDNLINKQADLQEPLFDIIKERSYIDQGLSSIDPGLSSIDNIQPKVIGIYNGEFNNNELISF